MKGEAVNEQTFAWQLCRNKLRQACCREGRNRLRTNLTEEDPVKLWKYHTQLTQVEEGFKNLKGDLALRPVYHQREVRIESHIFVAFLAYCLHVRLSPLAEGRVGLVVIARYGDTPPSPQQPSQFSNRLLNNP